MRSQPGEGGGAVGGAGDLVAAEGEHVAERFAEIVVVVDEEHSLHGVTLGPWSGSERTKVLPSPGRLSTWIEPPWRATMACAT